MFIIYFIFLATVFANSYEKYIDLLPEEEKQEFLDHVARRVMENVESKEGSNKNTFSIELTDDQLKKHNDFVQTILKQESEQMRRNKGGKKKHKEDNKSDEELKVKPLTTEADSAKTASSETDQADSSYDIKRRGNDDSGQENSTVSNEETATQNVTVQKRSIQSDEESVEKDLATKSSAESKTEVFEVVASTKFQDLTAQKSTSATEALPTGNFRRSLNTDSIEASGTDAQNSTTTEKNDITTTTAINEIETQISDTTTNLPEHKSQEDTITTEKDQTSSTIAVTTESAQETTTVNANSKENEEKTTTVDTETNNVTSTLSSTLSDVSTTEIATDTTAILSTTEKSETKPTESNDNIKSTTSTSNNTAEEKVDIETDSTTAGLETSTVETTTSLPLIGLTTTPTNIEEIPTKKPKKSKSKLAEIKNTENSTVLNDVKKEKKKDKVEKEEKVKGEDEDDKDFEGIQKKKYKETVEKDEECGIQTCNRYRVYEVQWPVSAENQSPFLRSKDPIVDQPYFVPIYNYSPNKAYYNPENRRGPNAVEENSIEVDVLRNGDNHVNDNAGAPEFEIDLEGLMSKFGKYSKKKKYDKIAELLMKKLKAQQKPVVLKTIKLDNLEAVDNLVPLNNVKGGLKDQIRAIRDVLHTNRHSKHNKRQKKEIENETFRFYDIADRDISMDYFYGRSKSKHDNFKNFDTHKNLDSEILNNLFPDHEVVKVISLKPTEFRTKHKNKNKSKKVKEEENKDKDNKDKDNTINESKDKIDDEKKDVKTDLISHNNEAKFNSYMNALKELIGQDNNALKQYDWLSTTVQIHAALSKLKELVNRVQNTEAVHPADLQILKYTIFLYNFAIEIRQANHYGSKLRKKLMLPKNKKRKQRFHMVKDKGLLNRVWLYLRTLMPDLTDQEELTDLSQFLLDIEDGLFDLHEAVRNIATVTKYNNQNWYTNLKDLYLSTDEKQLREVLLHISFSRLVDLVEFSCRNGVEDDFVEYMKSHKDVAKRTLEEILFVLKIVDEINNNSP